MTVDWTINVGNLLVMGSGVGSFLWGAIKMREALHDLKTIIGEAAPQRFGILGRLEDHDDQIDEIGKLTRRQRELLIELNAGLPDGQRIRIERS